MGQGGTSGDQADGAGRGDVLLAAPKVGDDAGMKKGIKRRRSRASQVANERPNELSQPSGFGAWLIPQKTRVKGFAGFMA